MEIDEKTLRKDYQYYSLEYLVLKYDCSEDLLKKLLKQYNINRSRFTLQEKMYVQKYHRYLSDNEIASMLRKSKEDIIQLRHRNWLLKKDEWSSEKILLYLKKRDSLGYCLTKRYIEKNPPFLLDQISQNFETLSNAFSIIGVDYSTHEALEKNIEKKYSDPEKIKAKIKKLKKRKKPLQYSFIVEYDRALLAAARDLFGSWGKALENSGLNYAKIRLNRTREVYKGYFFETLLRETFEYTNKNLGRPSKEENPLRLQPDFYDIDKKKWIDAKLRPWSIGVEETIRKYSEWSNKLEIIYLQGDSNFELTKRNDVKFVPIDNFYGILSEERSDLIVEFEALKLNKTTNRFKNFIENAKASYQLHIQDKEDYENPYVGLMLPTVFINENGDTLFNPTQRQDKAFRETATDLVKEIFKYNTSFFLEKNTQNISIIDIEKFTANIKNKYSHNNNCGPEFIKYWSSKITFSFSNRVYRSIFFIEPKDYSKKLNLIQAIENIVANEGEEKLSDKKIQMCLKDQGFQIARRTVSKYRRLIGIRSSRRRNKLFTKDMI
ncbi:hypothetical protein [Candidatus Uabimicrobium sp. HlEnr_7]|uniref:RNA polymerase factor sigma-54 n=1 Tax=Candidatus Uabimicrobium helgolandensis TaxID=3095367 RepID=UPI003556A0A9